MSTSRFWTSRTWQTSWPPRTQPWPWPLPWTARRSWRTSSRAPGAKTKRAPRSRAWCPEWECRTTPAPVISPSWSWPPSGDEHFFSNGPFLASFSIYFCLFYNKLQLKMCVKFFPMSRFEPQISSVGSNSSANCATTTAFIDDEHFSSYSNSLRRIREELV